MLRIQPIHALRLGQFDLANGGRYMITAEGSADTVLPGDEAGNAKNVAFSIPTDVPCLWDEERERVIGGKLESVPFIPFEMRGRKFVPDFSLWLFDSLMSSHMSPRRPLKGFLGAELASHPALEPAIDLAG